ncbi:hypothetical protein J3B02_001067 [Coemansia erecta]|nr:hypothetical protein J3B02_001067 [Coemansia erecta]
MGKTLPLALVYVVSLVTRYWAMQRNSIHGGIQVTLALQPLVIIFMSRHKIAEHSSSRSLWIIAITCIFVALAVWSPAFRMVYFEETFGILENASKLYFLVTSWVLAFMAVALSSLFYISATQFFDSYPGVSLLMFVRHFSSLCFLLLLVVWPVVESPVGVLETVDSRGIYMALGVAAIGALAFVLKMWLLTVPLVGGPAGLCMLEHYRTLICLGIGWWVYGYLYSGLQMSGLVIGGGALVLWSLCRIIQAKVRNK